MPRTRVFVLLSLLGAACVASFVACTTTSSNDVAGSGGGASNNPPSDAPSSDAIEPADTGADGGGSDGSGGDSAVIGDGGRLFDAACGTDGSFCWAYDTPPYIYNPMGPPYLTYYAGGTGTFAVVDAGYSAPNAAQYTLTDGGFAVQYIDLPMGTTWAACGAHVKILSGDVKVGGLVDIGTGNTQGVVGAKLATPASTTADLQLDNGRGVTTALGTVPLNQWFEVQIAFTGGAYSAFVQTAASATSAAADAGDPMPPNSGLWQLGSLGAWQVLYDDLACVYR